MNYSFNNRFNSQLDILELEVLWDNGKISFDPNQGIVLAINESI